MKPASRLGGSTPDLSPELDHVTTTLRDARAGADDADCAAGGTLPAVEPLTAAIEAIIRALFPAHLGPPGLDLTGKDAFVRVTLQRALDLLFEQVRHELQWNARCAGNRDADVDGRATEIARRFLSSLPDVRVLLQSDVVAAYRGDPAARSVEEVLICYPGVKAVVYHRLAHALHGLGTPLIARMIAEVAHSATGVDIHPGARIGGSFFIDHGTGVVIGETAVIGERVRLYQAVTLGSRRFAVDADGALVKGAPRHPIVEDDVVIYAGATILGRITIGRGSIVGGNVWVTRSLPPGSTISQAQSRSEVFEAGGGI
jgi:serine O-acetyltransferase